MHNKSTKIMALAQIQFSSFVGVAFFAIVLQSKCKAQYQQRHHVLQELNNKTSRRLIARGRCLCRWWWIVFNFCRKCRGVNLPNKVFLHHLYSRVTMANIFKINGGILPYIDTRKFLVYVYSFLHLSIY